MLSYLPQRCMCRKHVPQHIHALWQSFRGTGFSHNSLPRMIHHCSVALCRWRSAIDRPQLGTRKLARADGRFTLSSRLGRIWKTRGSVWPLLTRHSWNVLATTSGAPKNPPVTTARLCSFASSLPISLHLKKGLPWTKAWICVGRQASWWWSVHCQACTERFHGCQPDTSPGGNTKHCSKSKHW